MLLYFLGLNKGMSAHCITAMQPIEYDWFRTYAKHLWCTYVTRLSSKRFAYRFAKLLSKKVRYRIVMNSASLISVS